MRPCGCSQPANGGSSPQQQAAGSAWRHSFGRPAGRRSSQRPRAPTRGRSCRLQGAPLWAAGGYRSKYIIYLKIKERPRPGAPQPGVDLISYKEKPPRRFRVKKCSNIAQLLDTVLSHHTNLHQAIDKLSRSCYCIGVHKPDTKCDEQDVPARTPLSESRR